MEHKFKGKKEQNYEVERKKKVFFLPPSHINSKWKDCIKDERILEEIEYIIKNYNGYIYNELRKEKKKIVVLLDGWRDYYSKEEDKIYNLFNFTIEYSEKGKVVRYIPEYYDDHNNKLLLKDNNRHNKRESFKFIMS